MRQQAAAEARALLIARACVVRQVDDALCGSNPGHDFDHSRQGIYYLLAAMDTLADDVARGMCDFDCNKIRDGPKISRELQLDPEPESKREPKTALEAKPEIITELPATDELVSAPSRPIVRRPHDCSVKSAVYNVRNDSPPPFAPDASFYLAEN